MPPRPLTFCRTFNELLASDPTATRLHIHRSVQQQHCARQKPTPTRPSIHAHIHLHLSWTSCSRFERKYSKYFKQFINLHYKLPGRFADSEADTKWRVWEGVGERKPDSLCKWHCVLRNEVKYVIYKKKSAEQKWKFRWYQNAISFCTISQTARVN